MIEETPIVELLAVIFMLLFAKNSKETRAACFFIILIESITFIYHNYLDIYFNYLVIFYAYAAIIYGGMALKSSFMSVYAYILYAVAYFLFAMEDTMMEWGVIISDSVFYGNYSVMMYGCLAFLVYSVTYGRIDSIKLRAYSFMS